MITDDILASIDGALEDYATSDDAMRWTPPPERWDEPVVRDPENLVERRLAEGWDGYAAMADLAVTWRAAMRGLKGLIDQVADAFRRSDWSVWLRLPTQQPARLELLPYVDLTPLGPVGCEPDLRAAALAARRNRNTGPAAGRYLATGQRSRR